jgi:probable F420-dependent oxidoreductase
LQGLDRRLDEADEVSEDVGTMSANVPPQLSMQLVTFSDADEPDWTTTLEQAQAADQAGIDRLAVSDHIAFGENLDAYSDPSKGGTAGGMQPTGPDGHWLEPLTVLSLLAGQTSHARLQTGILLAALRRPAVLAKTLATLDVLSNGRVDLGVGVGWQREEYDVAGLDFDARGRLLDHCLEVCERLWTHQTADYRSEELSFDNIHAMPKPTQTGGVPVWVSGRANNRVVDRLVRFGVGWIPWGDDIADPVPGITRIRAALTDAGRDAAELQVQGVLPVVRTAERDVNLEATMAGLAPLLDAGVTDFKAYLRLTGGRQQTLDELSPLVAAFRAAVGRD